MSPKSALETLIQHNSKTSLVEKKVILHKISEMTNLPTPSANMMKVMLLLRDEDVKIGTLVEALEKDQSMVAQILKLVNSGFYGLRKTVESVEHAIALLGIINIKQVVYSASIMEFFSDDEQLEWNHSYSTSVMMGSFIKENELPGINVLPLAMLMHDLGKVVLRRFSPKKYRVAIQHASNDKIPVFRIEDAMLQINHAEVGGFLLKKWDSSEDIVKPVLQHHMETVPEDFIFETALVQFVNWADCRCRDIPAYEPTLELMNAAGIDEIDKDYWLNKQSALIETLEKKQGMLREGAPQAVETKNLDRDKAKPTPFFSIPEKGTPERHEPQSPPAAAAHGMPKFANVNDTVAIRFKSNGDASSAQIVSVGGGEQPKITARINNPALSDKEVEMMRKTYKHPGEAIAQTSQTQASAHKGEEEEETAPEAAAEPMAQALKRNAPVVNIHPLPPQPEMEEEKPPTETERVIELSEPGFRGVQRPTQIISRKTGMPVPQPVPEPEPEPEPLPEEESMEDMMSTGLSIDIEKGSRAGLPPLKPRVKKGFFATILDWFRKNS